MVSTFHMSCLKLVMGVEMTAGLSRRAAIEQEFQKNKELGDATGCWKSGMLVEDDNGSVRKALEELSRS